MTRQIKLLLIRTLVFFLLTVAIWIVAFFFTSESIQFNKTLAAISILPGVCYVVYAFKLLTVLGIDGLYPRIESYKQTKNLKSKSNNQ